MDLRIHVVGATPEELRSGVEAAQAVFGKAGVEPPAAARAWSKLTAEREDLTEEETARSDVWEEAEGAALAACCAGWEAHRTPETADLEIPSMVDLWYGPVPFNGRYLWECLRAFRDDGQGVILDAPSADELDGFVGVAAECHENAKRWVLAHPEWTVQQGWLNSFQTQFVRHSVVRGPDGRLLEVTPREHQLYHIFVTHEAASHAYGWPLPPYADLGPFVQPI